MSEAQRKVVIAVGAAILVALLFPPFQWIGTHGGIFNAGYAFLLTPPHSGAYRAVVNVGVLLTEWLAGLLVGGLVFYALRPKKEPSGVPPN